MNEKLYCGTTTAKALYKYTRFTYLLNLKQNLGSKKLYKNIPLAVRCKVQNSNSSA